MTAKTQPRPNVDYGPGDMARANEILRTIVGSGVHGIAIAGTDDHDEMGVFIEPPQYVVGVSAWSYVHNREHHTEGHGVPNYTYRTQPEGERSGPGDTDLMMYSLRKYIRLAAKGNPTALLPLYAPTADVLAITDAGHTLREHRAAFLSIHAVRRFLGYMQAQHDRMMGGGKRNRVPSRPELVEQYGWDTKFGSHALRLAMQGHEIATTGHLSLPLRHDDRERVLAVKRGEVPREEVSAQITELSRTVQSLLDRNQTGLPPDADWEALNTLSLQLHFDHWGVR